MRTGKLRHRVTILKPVDPEETDEGGQQLDEPIEVMKRWAERRDLMGTRLWAAHQIHNEARTEFRMRWTDKIEHYMYIQHGSERFEIVSLADPEGLRRELVATCRTVKP